ncbi:MAG: hypothetical protein ACHP6H_01315 [Legionellales bacterium]
MNQVTLYLTSVQYNGITTLTDEISGLSWLEFIQFYGNCVIVKDDLQALQQSEMPYATHQKMAAFQWAQAAPIIANGINSVQLTLGAITGSFQAGETISQATSMASGTVYSISGDIMVVSGVSGTFDTSHVITGGTSGATSTPSALGGSAFLPIYTNLAYLFGCDITGDETSQNPFTIQFEPEFTFEYSEPIQSDEDVYAVFSNLKASTSASFTLNYVSGAEINTQSVTTDGNGTAVVVFNTGTLTGGTSEIEIVVSQIVATHLTGTRAAVTLTRTLYAQVS